MLNEINLKTPAKINLFLRILNQRKDGYHNIQSGITFINLFDELKIKKSKSMNIKYSGFFKPKNEKYKNCIIKKTLQFLKLDKNNNLEINIKKNIPTMAGLGSSSSDAAALIKGLSKLKILKMKKDIKLYSQVGADIPVFLYGKNAIVKGIGEKVSEYNFSKYFFLIVKPEINFSTKKMYNEANIYLIKNKNKIKYKNVNELDYGNDFQKIAINNSNEIVKILNFLENTNNSFLTRMTGSGSCCYSIYKKINDAKKAQNNFKKKFPKLWSFVGENNFKNY